VHSVRSTGVWAFPGCLIEHDHSWRIWHLSYRWSLDTYEPQGHGTSVPGNGNGSDEWHLSVVALSSNGSNLPTSDPQPIPGTEWTGRELQQVPHAGSRDLPMNLRAARVGNKFSIEIAYVASSRAQPQFFRWISTRCRKTSWERTTVLRITVPDLSGHWCDTFKASPTTTRCRLRSADALHRVQLEPELHLVSLSGRSGFLRLWRRAGTQTVQRSYDPAASYGSSNFGCAECLQREESSMSCPSAKGRCP